MFHTEALRLEELLAVHGMAVRVGQASLSDDSIRFPLQLGLGTTTRRLLTLSHSIANEAGYSRCRLRREGRTLFLELPRNEGAGLRYGDLLAMSGAPPTGSALLGLMESGASVSFSLADPTMGNVLVTAGAGEGKSDLLRVLALGMASHHAARHWRLALLECEGDGLLASLRGLPHCWGWSGEPLLAIGWLVRLVTEMAAREVDSVASPRVLALVDDVDCVLRVGGGVARAVLRALLERGPAVGIHLILATREEGVARELGSRVAVRLQGTGSPGRFALHHRETVVPIMTARLDESEAAAVVQRMGEQRIRLVARPLPVGGAA